MVKNVTAKFRRAGLRDISQDAALADARIVTRTLRDR
jgi:hypothetical protein